MYRQSDKEVNVAINIPRVPGFDNSARTVTLVKISICLAIASGIACWAIGAWVIAEGASHVLLMFEAGELTREAILFVISGIITVTNDALGYVHTVALRWALYREGRLEYNTNPRFFTSARTSFANRWYMNILSAAMLVLSYTCVSVLLIRSLGKLRDVSEDERTEEDGDDGVYGFGTGLSALPLALLGFSLFVQVLTAILCLRQHDTQLPTWTASPLANTLAALHGHSGLRRRPNRCMMPASEAKADSQPRKPVRRQPYLWSLRYVKWIVLFLWTLCIMAWAWTAAMIRLTITLPRIRKDSFSFQWTPLDEVLLDQSTTIQLSFFTTRNNSFKPGMGIFLAILFLWLVQGIQALGLHCLELLVNMSRDENAWQQAGRYKGVLIGSPPLIAALTSWRMVSLTLLKTVIHWLLGQSFVPFAQMVPGQMSNGDIGTTEFFVFRISPSRVLVFAILSSVAAMYGTFLAFWRVKSPQPAAWGHVQTLADLIDDWRTIDGKIWWGDKGSNEVSGYRHAGTSYSREKVGKLDMAALYAEQDACIS